MATDQDLQDALAKAREHIGREDQAREANRSVCITPESPESDRLNLLLGIVSHETEIYFGVHVTLRFPEQRYQPSMSRDFPTGVIEGRLDSITGWDTVWVTPEGAAEEDRGQTIELHEFILGLWPERRKEIAYDPAEQEKRHRNFAGVVQEMLAHDGHPESDDRHG